MRSHSHFPKSQDTTPHYMPARNESVRKSFWQHVIAIVRSALLWGLLTACGIKFYREAFLPERKPGLPEAPSMPALPQISPPITPPPVQKEEVKPQQNNNPGYLRKQPRKYYVGGQEEAEGWQERTEKREGRKLG